MPGVIQTTMLTAAAPAGAALNAMVPNVIVGPLPNGLGMHVPSSNQHDHRHSRFGLRPDSEMVESPGNTLFPHCFFEAGFMGAIGPVLFHITVWQHCRLMWTDEPVGKEVYNPDHMRRWNGVLMFRTCKARSDFRRWWVRYSKLFDEALPHQNYLPVLKPGTVTGAVVAHRTRLDATALPIMDVSPFTDESSLYDGLTDILQPWCWIAHNCSKPVWRVPGGWLFRSQREAASFVLCDKGKDLGPIPSRE